MQALCGRNAFIKASYEERVGVAALQEMNSRGTYSVTVLASTQSEVFE